MTMKRWHRAIGGMFAGMLSMLAVIVWFPSLTIELWIQLPYIERLVLGIPLLFISLWMMYQLCKYRWVRLPFEDKSNNY